MYNLLIGFNLIDIYLYPCFSIYRSKIWYNIFDGDQGHCKQCKSKVITKDNFNIKQIINGVYVNDKYNYVDEADRQLCHGKIIDFKPICSNCSNESGNNC